jgi:hypothetical protein
VKSMGQRVDRQLGHGDRWSRKTGSTWSPSQRPWKRYCLGFSPPSIFEIRRLRLSIVMEELDRKTSNTSRRLLPNPTDCRLLSSLAAPVRKVSFDGTSIRSVCAPTWSAGHTRN